MAGARDRNRNTLTARVLRALKEAQCLSLDVFDTALLRKTFYPRDLYRFVEDEFVQRWGESLRGLANARLEAERRADRAAAREGGGSPQHMVRIYEKLGRIHPAAAPHLDALRERELELESKMVVRNEWCHLLFREAKAMNKRVFFVSDMYLPSDRIAEWLEREGYVGYERLYVSAEAGASKYDGRLFERLLQDTGLGPSDFVHVGDAFEGDFSVPSKMGLSAFWFQASRERVLSTPRFSYLREFGHDSRFASRGDRLTLGLLAREELNHPEDPEPDAAVVGQRVGYQVLGPVQLSFVSWIVERARRLELEDVYFIARDAWITKRVFDAWAERGLTSARAHYLRASRVSAFISRMAEMTTEAAVDDIFSELAFFGMDLSVGRHLVRLGLDPHRLRERVESSSLGSLSRVVDSPELRQAYLRFILGLEDEIRERVESHREAYDRYLNELNVGGSRRVGVVDNTSSGRTFLRLRDAFKSRNPEFELIHGLYTYVPPEALRLLKPGDDVEGWLYNYTDEGISDIDLDFRSLYEDTMLSAPENSFVRAELKDGEVAFVSHPGPDIETYERFTRHVHDGALRFVHDFLDAAEGDAPSRNLAYAGLKRFCYAPTPDEAEFFRGRPCGDWTFEDGDWSYLVPPTPRWMAFEPLSVRRDLQRAFWREGYMASLPPAMRNALEAYQTAKERLAPIRVRWARTLSRGPGSGWRGS